MATPLVKDYSADDVKKWATASSNAMPTLIDTFLVFVLLFGLLLFIGGIIRYMKEQRDSVGGRGNGPHAVWMMVGGACCGCLSAIAIFGIRVMSLQ